MMRYALTPFRAVCPICRAEQANLLYSISSAQAAQHFILREAEPERHEQLRGCIEALWGQPLGRVLRCQHCRFCYSHPFVAGNQAFYSLVYSSTTYPVHRWEFRATSQMLQELGQTNFKLLEVGAGNGMFLRTLAPALTPVTNVVATEFSSGGRQALEAQGFQSLAVDIRDLDDPQYQAHFNVICMFQVLEHLDGLDALFQSLARLAGPEALLFISTPNPSRVEYQELHGALLDMPPHHVGRWNKACFEIIGQRHGWQLVRYEIDSTESFLARALNFLIYRFQRESHGSRTLANWLRRSPHRQLRRFTQLFGLALYSVVAFPTALGLRAPNLGGTQWVCLRRTA